MQWWVFLILIACAAFAYLITNKINTSYQVFKKLKMWYILPFPFIVFILVGVPLIIANVDFNITFYAAGIPFVLCLGFSTALFLERYNIWREQKLAKANQRQNKRK